MDNNNILLKLSSNLTAMELKAYGKAGAIAEEVLSSLRTVFSYNGQEREKKRFALNNKYLHFHTKYFLYVAMTYILLKLEKVV